MLCMLVSRCPALLGLVAGMHTLQQIQGSRSKQGMASCSCSFIQCQACCSPSVAMLCTCQVQHKQRPRGQPDRTAIACGKCAQTPQAPSLSSPSPSLSKKCESTSASGGAQARFRSGSICARTGFHLLNPIRSVQLTQNWKQLLAHV